MNKEITLYSLAINYIIKNKIQPEKAFDLAFRKLTLDNSRRKLYEEFLKILRSYYYYSNIYQDVDEIVVNSLKENKIDLPLWVKERLSYLKLNDYSALFNRNVWIRINTLKTTVEETIKSLKLKGFEMERDEFPFLFKLLKSKERVSNTEEFKEGKIIVQDKASVKVVEILNPKPYEKILEIGSAPGMKTSLIQQITNNKSYVIAVDISKKRLYTQKALMQRLGVENVELLLADGENIPIRNVDKILIDAPCSNSGTINADPSVFMRITKQDVIRLSRLQRNILQEAFRLKKPVVYSTCSLFPEEGEKVIEKYSNYLVKINNDPSHYGYIRSKVWLRVMRFYPHIHGSEGFFIAKLDFSKTN